MRHMNHIAGMVVLMGNKEYISQRVKIEGATTSVNIRGVVSFYRQKYQYPSVSIPVSGTFQAGDEVKI